VNPGTYRIFVPDKIDRPVPDGLPAAHFNDDIGIVDDNYGAGRDQFAHSVVIYADNAQSEVS
jgi:hypothetical protein